MTKAPTTTAAIATKTPWAFNATPAPGWMGALGDAVDELVADAVSLELESEDEEESVAVAESVVTVDKPVSVAVADESVAVPESVAVAESVESPVAEVLLLEYCVYEEVIVYTLESEVMVRIVQVGEADTEVSVAEVLLESVDNTELESVAEVDDESELVAEPEEVVVQVVLLLSVAEVDPELVPDVEVDAEVETEDEAE